VFNCILTEFIYNFIFNNSKPKTNKSHVRFLITSSKDRLHTSYKTPWRQKIIEAEACWRMNQKLKGVVHQVATENL
jgi:hypothetical protein